MQNHSRNSTPPEQEMLILEQRRCPIIQPYASLRMDDFIRRSDLEIPRYDQIPDQRHIHSSQEPIAQRFPLGCKPEFNQGDIRLIGKVDAVDALLIIGRDIQVPVPHTAFDHPLRIGGASVPVPNPSASHWTASIPLP